MKRKIGILGGSFDPVHFGHLNLAICLMESCGLDEVLFVPTSLSPFKEATPPVATSLERFTMLKSALKPLEKFHINEEEIHRSGPVYTIDTVRKLAQNKHLQLHLLLGEDHLHTFHKWKDVEELILLAPPLIGGRTTEMTTLPKDFTATPLRTVKIPLLDISSTMIRERLFQGKYCGHLVPAEVLDLIKKKNLYHKYDKF